MSHGAGTRRIGQEASNLHADLGSTEHMLSADEATTILGVLPKTVREWAHRGFLPGQQSGGRRVWRFSESTVRAMIGRKPDRRPSAGLVLRVRTPELQAFTDALTRALARSGLTLRAVARACGLSRATIQGWLSGHKTPYRDNLTRLAEVVNEPALLDLIETRHRTIKLVCRECEDERDEPPGRVRAFERGRSPDRFFVDWKQGTAEHTCHSCWGKSLAKAQIGKVIKRDGHNGLIRQATNLATWRANLGPEERRARAAVASAASAATAHLRRPATDLERARSRLFRLTEKVKGTISLCRNCQLIVYTPEANARWRRGHGRQLNGNFHRSCLLEWPERTAWVAACKRAHQEGSPPPPPPPLPKKAAHSVSEAWLAEAYTTTVRYFRQHERIRRQPAGRAKRSLSITALASELVIQPRTLHQRVERFLSYLPNDPTATGAVKVWCEVFLTLKANLPRPPQPVRKTADSDPQEIYAQVAQT